MLWLVVGVGAIWLLVVSESFRKTALIIVALITTVGLLTYLHIQSKTIPLNQVVLSEVRDEGSGLSGGVGTLVGNIRNNSSNDLASARISYELFDCPTKKTPITQCASNDKQLNVLLDGAQVPAGGQRSFSVTYYFDSERPTKGFKRTEFIVTEANSK